MSDEKSQGQEATLQTWYHGILYRLMYTALSSMTCMSQDTYLNTEWEVENISAGKFVTRLDISRVIFPIIWFDSFLIKIRTYWHCGQACDKHVLAHRGLVNPTDIAQALFMGPTWGSSGADRSQVGPMLVPCTLLSGLSTVFSLHFFCFSIAIPM